MAGQCRSGVAHDGWRRSFSIPGDFKQGSTVYIGTFGSSGATSYSVRTYTGTPTLGAPISKSGAYLNALFIDSAGIYMSESIVATTTESLIRTTLGGATPTTLAAEGGRYLATDDTRLYFVTTDFMTSAGSLRRAGARQRSSWPTPGS